MGYVFLSWVVVLTLRIGSGVETCMVLGVGESRNGVVGLLFFAVQSVDDWCEVRVGPEMGKRLA